MPASRRFAPLGALSFGLLSMFPLVFCGCSGDSKDAAGGKPGASAAPGEKAEQGDRDRELKQPLLRKFDEALDNVPGDDAEDLGTSVDDARGILLEADETLTRIKKDNQQGLWRANHPPRRVHPVPPPETEKEDAKKERPEAEQSKGAEPKPATEQKSGSGQAEALPKG